MSDRRTQPNLLFIFTDQQRFDTLSCYGNEYICTPHLNGLADRSFVFDTAYVTQPVCTPARSSIMTGLYPQNTGCLTNNIWLKDETRTIAERLPADYIRAYYGKWHLGDEVVPQHGFSERLSTEDQYRPFYRKTEYLDRLSSYHSFLQKEGFHPDSEMSGAGVFSREFAALLPEDLTKAAYLGREVASFIDRNKGFPFAMYVNFLEPHPPYISPFGDLYPPERILVGPTFLKPPSTDASMFHRLRADYFGRTTVDGHDLSTEEGWRRLRSEYFGNVTLVDKSVGTMLAALERNGVADNTIIVFTTEHGEMLGDHALLEKRTLYEECVRVPLLIHVPWMDEPPRILRGRFSQVDLVPTLLDLMGCAVPGDLDGVSRAQLLRGKDNLLNNDVVIQWNGFGDRDLGTEAINRNAALPWRSIISHEGWKLNLCFADQCELYNLNDDPHEQSNLFDRRPHRELVRDLTARIWEWQLASGDKAPLPTV